MKKTKVFLLICFGIIIAVLSGYFVLAFYYKDGFCLNTWINGVYCTGKTVEEVNAELLAKVEAPVIMITDRKGDTYSMDLSDMGYEADFVPALNQYMEEQKPLLWIDNVTFHQNHEIVPTFTYDEERLRATFEELAFVQNEKKRLTDYLLVRNWSDGYLLYDGLSDRLDEEKAFAALKEAVEAGNYHLDLTKTDSYYNIPLTEEQKKTKQLWEKVEAFQKCNLVYDMGDQEIAFDSLVMSDFIKTENGDVELDENGSLILDEKAIKEFIIKLAEEYDTYGKEREFKSTRGDVITVKGGTYGTQIDQKEEIIFLVENLLSDAYHTETKQIHVPSYKRTAMNRGKDDIGQTYIEVDMTEQKMYYYEEGNLMLETDVVTGNIGRHMGTPEGVNYVYNKQTNKILRGRDYASFVKFWMPVKGNYGIHDASWRKTFGGTIYQKNGSHGCINTPSDVMEELYEMVEIGTPVVMFY